MMKWKQILKKYGSIHINIKEHAEILAEIKKLEAEAKKSKDKKWKT